MAVSFDSRDGTLPDSADIEVTFNTPYGPLAKTQRTGYTFGGWWTGGDSAVEITSDTKVQIESNHTLYAEWMANEYTVTFDAQGGLAPDLENKPLTYGQAYGTLASTTKTGYTFQCWFTDPTGGVEVTPETTVQITEEQTLYAQWSESV